MSTDSTPNLLGRIKEYLLNGGTFNPEMMEHDKVRELILDCRTALVATTVLLEAIEVDGYGRHFDHVIKDSYTNVKELLK